MKSVYLRISWMLILRIFELSLLAIIKFKGKRNLQNSYRNRKMDSVHCTVVLIGITLVRD